MNRRIAAMIVLIACLSAHADPRVLPEEPLEIGIEPQWVFDLYAVDNYWSVKYKREAMQRVAHTPIKYERNPLIDDEGGYVCAVKDEDAGLIRMWYQTAYFAETKAGPRAQYGIAYAESSDGINWKRPSLGLYEYNGTRDNNIVWRGLDGKRGSGPFIIDVPEHDRRGYRYVLLYSDTKGMHVVGSHDGVHWDGDSDVRFKHIHSDTQNNIVYDPKIGQYVWFGRAKHIYRTFRGHVIDTGASRRMARMSSPTLWSEWEADPQMIFIPDEADARENFNFFYGMPTRIYGGVYFGFVWAFKMNTDIHTELAFSRDGIRFDRLPDRPKFIPRGDEGEWDDGMTFGGPHWIEMGDEWWFYYAGHDGPHESRERSAGIGLAKLRKEGFISMRGPRGGGVVSTRRIRWPGGDLLVNADATLGGQAEGELKVRISDERRKPLEGFNYDDCELFTGDSVRHVVRWNGRSMDALTDHVVRIEFFLRDADLYTFRAAGR